MSQAASYMKESIQALRQNDLGRALKSAEAAITALP